MNYLTPMVRPALRALFARGWWPRPARSPRQSPALRVLVLGIYLTDRPNQAARLVRDFAASRRHLVEQRWVALGQRGAPDDAAVQAVTVRHSRRMIPKFQLLNQMLAGVDLSVYDYVVFSDDDIVPCTDFVDSYFDWVHSLGFSLSQPARTRFSYRDHKFCLGMRGVKARETRFVEIGPVFVFDRRAAAALLPFNEASPMGWGYDYMWPALARQHGLHMGVIDAVPVDHSYRPQARSYDARTEDDAMRRFLRRFTGVTREQAQVNLHIYR